MQHRQNGVKVAPPAELVQCEHIATIFDALDRYDITMTRREHLAVDVAWQRRGACVLQSVIPQHTHQHLI